MQQNSGLFQEQLGQTLDRKSPICPKLTGSNHRRRAQFKRAETQVVGQSLLKMDPTVCPTSSTGSEEDANSASCGSDDSSDVNLSN